MTRRDPALFYTIPMSSQQFSLLRATLPPVLTQPSLSSCFIEKSQSRDLCHLLPHLPTHQHLCQPRSIGCSTTVKTNPSLYSGFCPSAPPLKKLHSITMAQEGALTAQSQKVLHPNHQSWKVLTGFSTLHLYKAFHVYFIYIISFQNPKLEPAVLVSPQSVEHVKICSTPPGNILFLYGKTYKDIHYANTDSFHLWYNILVHKIYTFSFSSLFQHHGQIYIGRP